MYGIRTTEKNRFFCHIGKNASHIYLNATNMTKQDLRPAGLFDNPEGDVPSVIHGWSDHEKQFPKWKTEPV